MKEEIKVTLATHWGYSRVVRVSNQTCDYWSVCIYTDDTQLLQDRQRGLHGGFFRQVQANPTEGFSTHKIKRDQSGSAYNLEHASSALSIFISIVLAMYHPRHLR